MGKTIYFIHGAYSADKTWGDIKRVLSEDRDMRDFSHRFTTHTTTSEAKKGLLGKLFGGNKGADIDSVVDEILSDISDLIKSNEEIYIAVHSLGGVSLRKAIMNLDSDSLNKIIKVIYFDTPGTAKGFNSISNIYGKMEAEEFGADAETVERICQEYSKIDIPFKEMMIYAAYGRKVDEESIPKCVREYEILSLRHPDCCKIDGNKHLGYNAMKRFFLDIKEEAPKKEIKDTQKEDGADESEQEVDKTNIDKSEE